MLLKFYVTLNLEHTNQIHKPNTRHLFSEQHNLKVFSLNFNIQGYTIFKVTALLEIYSILINKKNELKKFLVKKSLYTLSNL